MASVAPSSPIRIAELREHVEQGRVAELKMLLAELADEKCLYEHVGARDAVGNTAFHLACHHGHIECVRLLEESSSNTFAQTSAGMSGLMIAVERGHNKLCQHLLPMADLEATCNKGWTAFIHACAAGQADCVEILVRADCDTKAKDKSGFSGKDIAASRDDSAVLMRLRALVLEKLSAAGHSVVANNKVIEAPARRCAPTKTENPVKERPTSYFPAGDALLLSREATSTDAGAVAADDDSERLELYDTPTSTSDYTQNQFGTPDTQPTDSILNFAGAPGTDEERAERLARMMSAQCTLEPPEVVGLRTGWKPAGLGNGVTPDGSVPNTFGGSFGEGISSGGFSGLFDNPADPLTPLGAAAVSFVAASGTAASRRTSVAAAAMVGGGRPILNPLSPLGALGRGRGGWAAGSMDGGSSPGGNVHNDTGSSFGAGQLVAAGSGAGAVSKRPVFNFHMGSTPQNKSPSVNGSSCARIPPVRRKQVKHKEDAGVAGTSRAARGTSSAGAGNGTRIGDRDKSGSVVLPRSSGPVQKPAPQQHDDRESPTAGLAGNNV